MLLSCLVEPEDEAFVEETAYPQLCLTVIFTGFVFTLVTPNFDKNVDVVVERFEKLYVGFRICFLDEKITDLPPYWAGTATPI